MHPDAALRALAAVAGVRGAGEILSISPDGRIVAAFGELVVKQGLPGEAERTAATMAAVADALGPDAPLVLPALRWRRGDALGLERLRGAGYCRLAAEEEGPLALAAAGRAVAALHAIHAAPLPAAHLDAHVHELIRPHPMAIGLALPDLAGRIEAVMTEISARAASPRAGLVPCVVHRDLHLGQLFATTDGRVALIDWDLAALGDAALDLGNFRAYIATRLPGRAKRLWDSFVAGYGALPGLVGGYEALMLVRMAAKAHRLGGAAAAKQVEALVAAAERTLIAE